MADDRRRGRRTPSKRKAKRKSTSRMIWAIAAVLVLIYALLVLLEHPSIPQVRDSYQVKHLQTIQTAAEDYEVDPYLVLAVIRTESSWEEDAISRSGAEGLMQLMPTTARYVVDSGIVKSDAVDAEVLMDPYSNIQIGAAYLGNLIKRFGDETVALAAYNAGPTNAERWLSEGGSFEEAISYPETRAYVQRVMKAEQIYRELHPGIFE